VFAVHHEFEMEEKLGLHFGLPSFRSTTHSIIAMSNCILRNQCTRKLWPFTLSSENVNHSFDVKLCFEGVVEGIGEGRSDDNRMRLEAANSKLKRKCHFLLQRDGPLRLQRLELRLNQRYWGIARIIDKSGLR
jgi:hypothetical protein